ncbi:hypothetical protein [Companilactobacillus mishanensis]|uniref:Uncharacterized protein n=1 Tax=Companilactobacillus mishanensis TaxID=2486008 RepID=A0A5P0ZHZ9_9LACO|nr:hypothetical protein [Companilactobacillus mishanensis]MQS45215.1 hypothetical protein [Companilactobacillus mishanensis]MQS52693.1 hypothetical protein [Companilactobacillus mishanensis]
MTSFGSLFKALSGEKFRNSNFIILIELLYVIVILGLSVFHGASIDLQLSTGILAGAAFIFMSFEFIRLTVLSEKKYTSSTYRLIPVSDTKFYLTNLLSSFVNFVYVGLVQGILFAIAIFTNWNELNHLLSNMSTEVNFSKINTADIFKGFAAMIFVLLAIAILTWTTINLIHLLSKAASNFLPRTGKNLLTFILYVLVIGLVFRVVGFFTDQFSNSMQFFTGPGYNANYLGIWINTLIFLVIAAVEAVISIYLNYRWVDTNNEN